MKDFADLKKETLKDPDSRRAYARKKDELLAQIRLGELREARRITQQQLARSMKTTQSAVSRLERQTDFYLTTLRSYIEALGGRLELSAVFNDGRVEIKQLADLPTKSRAKGKKKAKRKAAAT